MAGMGGAVQAGLVVPNKCNLHVEQSYLGMDEFCMLQLQWCKFH